MAEYVEPSASYTSRVFGLNTGLTGTARFRLIDNDSTADDPIYGPSTAGIIEDPAGSGSYVFTGGVAPATDGKYSRIWDSGAATDLVPDEDMIVLTGLTLAEAPSGDVYADTDELARLLKINTPTTAQLAAMSRVLLVAAEEIDSEIDLADDADPLTTRQLAIAAEVNLERAVELWRAAPFGIIGIDSEIGGIHTSSNTWQRYAHMLAPLKNQWGFA